MQAENNSCGNQNNKLKVIFTEKLKKEKLFLIEVAIVLLFCIAAFIFSQYSPQHIFIRKESLIDSSVFRSVALAMQSGKMPYLDTFDHKGPLIYIINYIGQIIAYDSGIWLIEIMNLTVSMYFLYKIARLKCDRFFSVIVAFISITPLFEYFQGGNFTEEYALPLMIVSLYIFLEYLLNNKVNNRKVIVCGMCMGGVLMLRPNMISVWIVFCAFIFFKDIFEKKYQELLKFIEFFLLGVMVVIIPILIWLGVNGALYDFWNDYIIFNFQYSSEDSNLATTENKWLTFFYFAKNSLVVATIIILLYTFKKEKNKVDLVYLAYIVLTLLLICMSGRSYGHYGMIMIPTISYPFALLFAACQNSKIEKETSSVITLIVLIYILGNIVLPGWIGLFEKFPGIYKGRNDRNKLSPAIQSVCDAIIKNSDEDDTISVYGNRNMFYVLTKRQSASKYSYQFPIGTIRKEILEEYMEDIQKTIPQLIITHKDRFNDESMNTFLDDNNYELILETEDNSDAYRVYEHVDKEIIKDNN